jgi:hypothetical protein
MILAKKFECLDDFRVNENIPEAEISQNIAKIYTKAKNLIMICLSTLPKIVHIAELLEVSKSKRIYIIKYI